MNIKDEGKSADRLNVTERQVLQYLKDKSSCNHLKVGQEIVVIEEKDPGGQKDSNIR